VCSSDLPLSATSLRGSSLKHVHKPHQSILSNTTNRLTKQILVSSQRANNALNNMLLNSTSRIRNKLPRNRRRPRNVIPHVTKETTQTITNRQLPATRSSIQRINTSLTTHQPSKLGPHNRLTTAKSKTTTRR